MEAHSRCGTVKSRGGTGENSRSYGRGPTLRAHPQSGGYGKGGRESFLSSVTAIQTKNTGQPSSPCANRHVSTSLNIQHWAFPLHPLLRLIFDGPDRPRKTPCCCVRIYNPVIVYPFPLGSREMPMSIVSEHRVWRPITPFLKFRIRRLPKK